MNANDNILNPRRMDFLRVLIIDFPILLIVVLVTGAIKSKLEGYSIW